MSGYQYDPHAFDLMNELFTKQDGHMQAISGYLQGNCEASGAFSGIIGPLQGHYSGAYNDAHQGMQNGSTIAQHCATKIGESKQQVLADDKSAYEKMAALAKKNGHPMPPWHAPSGSTGGLGEGKELDEKGESKFFEEVKRFRAEVEWGSKGPGRLTGDPLDPLKPGELSYDQYVDPKSLIQHQIDNYVSKGQMAHYQHLADNDPGGHDAGYFRDQALLDRQYKFEGGFASGQSYAQEHLHTDAGSTSLHDSPWLDKDGRETLHTAAETPGKVLNIATALPATIQAGQHLHEAQETSTELSATAAGPSNTGSTNWANNDNSGGEW